MYKGRPGLHLLRRQDTLQDSAEEILSRHYYRKDTKTTRGVKNMEPEIELRCTNEPSPPVRAKCRYYSSVQRNSVIAFEIEALPPRTSPKHTSGRTSRSHRSGGLSISFTTKRPGSITFHRRLDCACLLQELQDPCVNVKT